jgi:hypothetical protein
MRIVALYTSSLRNSHFFSIVNRNLWWSNVHLVVQVWMIKRSRFGKESVLSQPKSPTKHEKNKKVWSAQKWKFTQPSVYEACRSISFNIINNLFLERRLTFKRWYRCDCFYVNVWINITGLSCFTPSVVDSDFTIVFQQIGWSHQGGCMLSWYCQLWTGIGDWYPAMR